MTPLHVNNEIIINASPEKVWNVLVNPEETKKYMFGCEALSDWQPGSRLDWKMLHEGQEMIPVTGHVVSLEENQKLVYTVFDPFAGYEHIPENYLTVVYELIPTGDNETLLKVSQGDFSGVANGAKRYEDSYNGGEGWNPILVQMKAQAEG